MKGVSIRYIITAIVIIILQALVFQYLTLGLENFNYFNILIYPLLIIILPVRTSTTILLLLAFFYGIVIDMFYSSPGIHTATLLLTAFLRPIVLGFIEPREGYSMNSLPNVHDQGFSWFLMYSSILMFIHLFVYFSIEAFTFLYIFDIWMKTIFSFILSYILVLIYEFLFERNSTWSSRKETNI